MSGERTVTVTGKYAGEYTDTDKGKQICMITPISKRQLCFNSKEVTVNEVGGGSVAEIARLAVSENPREREIANQENTKHYLLLKSLQ
jgi:hypothetical protein